MLATNWYTAGPRKARNAQPILAHVCECRVSPAVYMNTQASCQDPATNAAPNMTRPMRENRVRTTMNAKSSSTTAVTALGIANSESFVRWTCAYSGPGGWKTTETQRAQISLCSSFSAALNPL